MQVLQSHVGALTNHEVLEILDQRLKWHNHSQKKYNSEMPKTHKLYQSVWISKQITLYLSETTIASRQSREEINTFLQQINDFDVNNQLTRLEKLQIVNLCPVSEPLLYTVINQCHEKFPDQQDIDRLLAIIRKYSKEEEEEDEEDDDSD